MIINDRIWIARGAIVAVFFIAGCSGSNETSSDSRAARAPAERAKTARASVSHGSPGSPGSVEARDVARLAAKPGRTVHSTFREATVKAESLPALPAAAPMVVPPSPEQTRAAWTDGVALYESGDYAAASGTLGVAAAGRSDDAYTHYLLGLSLMKSGQPQEAEEALERSTSLAPGSRRGWTNLGRARMTLDDAEGALAASEKAIEIEASSADALHVQGRALYALGMTAPAREALERAIAAAPDNGYAANTLGWQLLVGGDFEGSIPFLELARERIPGVSFVHNNLAVAYERAGRTEEALDEYVACVEAGDPQGKAAASLARLRGETVPSGGDASSHVAARAEGESDVTRAATSSGKDGAIDKGGSGGTE